MYRNNKKKRSSLSKDDLENQKPKFMKPYEQCKNYIIRVANIHFFYQF